MRVWPMRWCCAGFLLLSTYFVVVTSADRQGSLYTSRSGYINLAGSTRSIKLTLSVGHCTEQSNCTCGLAVQLEQIDGTEWKNLSGVFWGIISEGIPSSLDYQFSGVKNYTQTKGHRLSWHQLDSSAAQFVFDMKLIQYDAIGDARIYISLGVLLVTYALIASELLNRVLVCMAADAVMILYFWLCDEHLSPMQAALAVDIDTILVIFGMMIIVGNFARTGFFDFLVVRCFKLSGGNMWILALIIGTVTAVVSMILPSITTVLLIAPVAMRLCGSIEVSPVPLVVISAILSTIGGTATLIGDPPNVLIGSALHISFVDFFVNMFPGTVMCALVALLYLQFVFREQLYVHKTIPKDLGSPLISSIKDKILLVKVLVVLVIAVTLFVASSYLGISLGWIAVFSALGIIMITAPTKSLLLNLQFVEWELLCFYIALFMLVGCTEQLGFMQWMGTILSDLILLSPPEAQLPVTIVLIIWLSGILSSFIDNTVFVRVVVPLMHIVSSTVDLPLSALGWALVFGGCLGGNSTLIGTSTNIVATGLLMQEKQNLSFMRFSKLCAPLTCATLATATWYMIARYCSGVARIVAVSIGCASLGIVLILFLLQLCIEGRRGWWKFSPLRTDIDPHTAALNTPTSTKEEAQTATQQHFCWIQTPDGMEELEVSTVDLSTLTDNDGIINS
ncbi:ArsB/NhaD family transporter [Pelomyxa schiedti]|nr:ArsB/NhaD family transporter [Pelomyxa schiedti]